MYKFSNRQVLGSSRGAADLRSFTVEKVCEKYGSV